VKHKEADIGFFFALADVRQRLHKTASFGEN
jgi:hypothetical protein